MTDVRCIGCGHPRSEHRCGSGPCAADDEAAMGGCDCPGVVRPLSEMRDAGLLWLLNRVVFHPRGYAIGFEVDEAAGGDVTGWAIYGEGDEPWRYGDDVDENDLFERAEAFLASLRDPAAGDG